jgi:hypothetical protein
MGHDARAEKRSIRRWRKRFGDWLKASGRGERGFWDRMWREVESLKPRLLLAAGADTTDTLRCNAAFSGQAREAPPGPPRSGGLGPR